MTLEAPALEGGAEPAVPPAVHEHEGKTDHDRGDRQGQVEQGAERPLAGELVAHQQHRHPHPEDRVEDDGDDRDDDAEPQRRHHVRVLEQAPQGGQPVVEGVRHDLPQGPGDQEEQVRDHQEAQQVGHRPRALAAYPGPGRGRRCGRRGSGEGVSHEPPPASGSRRRPRSRSARSPAARPRPRPRTRRCRSRCCSGSGPR